MNPVTYRVCAIIGGMLFCLLVLVACYGQAQMPEQDVKNAVAYYLANYPSHYLELPDVYSPRYITVKPELITTRYKGGGKWEFLTDVIVTRSMLTPQLPSFAGGGYTIFVRGIFYERTHQINITKTGTPLAF